MTKRLILICSLLISFCASLSAQELKVDKVVLLETDNDAVTKPHYDGNKRPCALLKFFIDDLPGVEFISSYIIDKDEITYQSGYYAVYVVQGTKSLRMKHSDYTPAEVKFSSDFDISLQGGKTYGVYVSTVGITAKKTQSIVFNIIPRKASIIVDGQAYTTNNGVLQVECAPGNHSYSITAEYCDRTSGKFEVTDITEPQVIPVKLKKQTAQLNFTCNVPEAVLFIDNKEIGTPGLKTVALGRHRIRVVAEDWKDHTGMLDIVNTSKQNLNVSLKRKEYIPIVITAQNCENPLLYVDNKAVHEWKNDGTPVKIRQGKHLITIEIDSDALNNKKEKIVQINQDTKNIVFTF